MKQISILILLVFSIQCYSQIDTIKINDYYYIFMTEKRIDYEDIETLLLSIYRLDTIGKSKYIIKHILECKAGDSNSMSVEIGDYLIKDSTIILYSFWCRQGDAPVSPWGARIQEYKVKINGDLIMDSSRIYIETSRQGWYENKGIEYLFTEPTSKEENEALNQYIREVENEYNAKFVFGEEADKLIKEVKEKFKLYIESLIKEWNKIDNSFGYKI